MQVQQFLRVLVSETTIAQVELQARLSVHLLIIFCLCGRASMHAPGWHGLQHAFSASASPNVAPALPRLATLS